MKSRTSPFIVLEGLDGSGTTTQAKLLHSHLEHSGIRSCLTYEPTDGRAGKLIRDILSGKLRSAKTGSKVVLSERTLCLLFAADRLDHTEHIGRERKRGAAIVCDRYILSSLAYQTLDPGISPAWVIEVNAGCAKPDLTILLDVPVPECARRLKSRRGAPTIYEKRAVLEAIDSNYRAMIKPYRKEFGAVVALDGAGTVEAVFERIRESVRSRLGIG
ncbi:MAG: dTMP kinase [Chitinivibrionia bacterium]|nr:dTMP kinase [Chitinivibrionia bacterium]